MGDEKRTAEPSRAHRQAAAAAEDVEARLCCRARKPAQPAGKKAATTRCAGRRRTQVRPVKKAACDAGTGGRGGKTSTDAETIAGGGADVGGIVR